MKSLTKLYYILILLFSLTTCYSQTNFLIGDWKVISISNEDYYLNAKTDSISFLSERFKEIYLDSIGKQNIIKTAKFNYLNDKFSFDKKGNFTQSSPFIIINCKYELNENKNVIVLYDKKVKSVVPYKFINGLLHFILTEQSGITYVLEKVTK